MLLSWFNSPEGMRTIDSPQNVHICNIYILWELGRTESIPQLPGYSVLLEPKWMYTDDTPKMALWKASNVSSVRMP